MRKKKLCETHPWRPWKKCSLESDLKSIFTEPAHLPISRRICERCQSRNEFFFSLLFYLLTDQSQTEFYRHTKHRHSRRAGQEEKEWKRKKKKKIQRKQHTNFICENLVFGWWSKFLLCEWTRAVCFFLTFLVGSGCAEAKPRWRWWGGRDGETFIVSEKNARHSCVAALIKLLCVRIVYLSLSLGLSCIYTYFFRHNNDFRVTSNIPMSLCTHKFFLAFFEGSLGSSLHSHIALACYLHKLFEYSGDEMCETALV